MESIFLNREFAKALLGFAFSLMTAFMMIIVTAIVISTGEETATCVTFAIISLASIASTFYFTYQMGKNS